MSQSGLSRGSCNCGAVTFRVDAPVTDIYVCHCSLCRKATGTIGVTVVVVSSSLFTWESGEHLVKRWAMPGHDWECSFCSHCGSHLPGTNDSSTMYIPVGLFTEGGENLQVKHHIWVSSKAAWHQIGDDGQQHHKGFNQK